MKLNEITNQHAEIEEVLSEYNIKNYTINSDGTVDVNGHVDFTQWQFYKFPVHFGKVAGNFSVYSCKNLTSLIGAPSEVGIDFVCSNCTNIMSLHGSPSNVGGDFILRGSDKIDDMGGCPVSIGRDLTITSKSISTLEGRLPAIVGMVVINAPGITRGGIGLILTGCVSLLNAWGPFKIIEKYLGRPDDIFECQTELIEAGYEAYAQI